jgi:hypothetical protein
LYCTTSAAILWNPPLRAYYEHLIANRKLHKVAMVATMRRLVLILNAIIKTKDAMEIALPGVNHRHCGLPTSPQAGRFARSHTLWTLWATLRTLSDELTFMTVAPRSLVDGRRHHRGPLRPLSNGERSIPSTPPPRWDA